MTPLLAEAVIYSATPSLPRRIVIGTMVSATLCLIYLLGCYITGYVAPMTQSYALWTFGLGVPMDLGVELFTLYKTSPNTATITTHRIVAPGGHTMALTEIGQIKRRLDTLLITSRDKKRQLQIKSLPHPTKFRHALEERLK